MEDQIFWSVIDCVLLFNLSLSCPQLLGFLFFIFMTFLSLFFDALVVSWDRFDRRCTCDGLYFSLLPFALCCGLLCWKMIGCFPCFLQSHSSSSVSITSVTQGKKIIWQCIFVTGIYLLVICMIVLFFFYVSLLLFLWRVEVIQRKEWVVMTVVVVVVVVL